MEHELYIPHRPREQRAMRGLRGRSSRAGPRARRDARGQKYARRGAGDTPTTSLTHKLIERGLNGDRCGGVLAWTVANVAERVGRADRPVLRRALHALDRIDAELLTKPALLCAVGYAVAFHDRWIRKPQHWEPDPAKGAQGQVGAFIRHLLCRFPVPAPFNWAWFNDYGPDNDYCARARGWFVHVGSGGSLRRAPGLAYPLSRAAAHAALRAPEHLTLPEALRYGQFIAHGVSEALASAAARTQLGRPNANNDTALVIARFLELNADLRAHHVQQVVDYVHARRAGGDHLPPEPHFTLAAVTARTVMREIHLWHAELNRLRSVRHVVRPTWPSCGIGGFEQIVMDERGELARWEIVELTTATELAEEGRAMHHCVLTYASRAASYHCAIFALRRQEGVGDGAGGADGATKHVATIELMLPSRQLGQVQGPCNRRPAAAAMEIIARWAALREVEVRR